MFLEWRTVWRTAGTTRHPSFSTIFPAVTCYNPDMGRRSTASRALPHPTAPADESLFAMERERQSLVADLEQVINELAAMRSRALATPLQIADLARRRRSLIASLVRIDSRISALAMQPPIVITQSVG